MSKESGEFEGASNGDPCVCGATDTWHPECYQEQQKAAFDAAIAAAEARGVAKGMERAAEGVYDAIKSYRSSYVQDEEGNGLELSDILAAGYGDADISNALRELANLSDHIYCDILSAAAEPQEVAEQ